MRPAVHGPRYQALRPLVVEPANADPATVCWRDGKTLAQHRPHRNGKPATWTAGHLHDGQADDTLTLDDLAPEASTCNYSAGASFGNRNRTEPRSAIWR